MTSAVLQEGASRERRSRMPWQRALAAWLLMAAAMTLSGIFRVKVLVPGLSEAAAGAVSAAMGIVLIQLIARGALLTASRSLRRRFGIASLWLAMTVVFEFTFGHYVDRKSFADLFENYDVLGGHLWPVVLASLVAAPFVWRNRRTS